MLEAVIALHVNCLFFRTWTSWMTTVWVSFLQYNLVWPYFCLGFEIKTLLRSKKQSIKQQYHYSAFYFNGQTPPWVLHRRSRGRALPSPCSHRHHHLYRSGPRTFLHFTTSRVKRSHRRGSLVLAPRASPTSAPDVCLAPYPPSLILPLASSLLPPKLLRLPCPRNPLNRHRGVSER